MNYMLSLFKEKSCIYSLYKIRIQWVSKHFCSTYFYHLAILFLKQYYEGICFWKSVHIWEISTWNS